MDATQKVLNQLNKRIQIQAPIADDMFVPNHSGVSHHPEAINNFLLLDQTSPQTISNGQPIFSQGLKITAGQDIRPTENSTTAINIAQADGTDFVTFDTTNKRVGIGTTTPNYALDIQKSVNPLISTTGSGQLNIANLSATTTDGSAILFTTLGTRRAQITAARDSDVNTNAGNLAFTVRRGSDSAFIEAIRIDNTGKVGIGVAPSFNFHLSIDGTTPAAALASGTTGAVVSNTSAAGFAGMVAANTANLRPLFKAIRARGTLQAPTAVALNDFIMSFLGAAYDGSALVIPATIDMYVDGTVASGSVPARISFVTGTSVSDRLERLAIKSDGEVQFPADGTSGGAGCVSWGAGQDGEILHTGSIFRVRSDVVTATDSLELRGGTNGTNFLIGANQEMALTANLLTFSDETNIAFNTSTGTKIGTATSQKLSFYNSTPIVQPTTAVAEAAFVENAGGTAVNVDSTFGGYTIQQIVKALQNLGLLA
jgi:hypothetical protein